MQRILADVWRRDAPHILSAPLRRYGDLGDCEDAAQKAAEAAAAQWPIGGVPDDPRAWLYAVRAHLLELKGDVGAATEQYRLAAQLTSSQPEQRYLNRRLRQLGH